MANPIEINKDNVCPYREDKVCIQISNIEKLNELMDTTVKKVEGVGVNVDILDGKVTGLSESLRLMIMTVNRTSENIDKVFKLHYDKALEDKDRVSNIELKMNEIKHDSDIDNMLQDFNRKEEKLDEFKEKKKDKKNLWQKAQLTVIGLGVAFILNGIVELGKDLYHLLITAPK